MLLKTALFKAIKTLQSFEEYRSFFQDILTPAEFQAIKDRWAVAALLDDEEVHGHAVRARLGLAKALIELNKLDEAREELDTALTLTPTREAIQ